MRFQTLPLRLQLLIIGQSLAAAVTAYLSWETPNPDQAGMLAFLVLCGVIGGACKVDVDVPLGRLSLAFTVTYFALIVHGTPAALLVGFLGTFTGVVCNLKDTNRINFARAITTQAIFNFSNGALAAATMGWVFYALGGRPGEIEPTRMALPVLVSALSYYLINTGGVTLAIAWSQNRSPLSVFKQHWAWAWPGFLAGACISAGLLWASKRLGDDPAVLLLVPPAYLVYYFYRLRSEKVQSDMEHFREMHRLNDAVIGSLAMAIEAKDRYTRKHVNRVREYAISLGEKLGVSESELQAIRIASLLHDIGKIGIPEAILCKPGKLTYEEFEIIKTHVDIGAAILDRIKFPWPVADVVRTHHERWDGLGYPRGLRGDDIPIGGRIISLVDVYDALTSDRPYRKAIPQEQAIAILRAGAGSQFDPHVVETFVALLPEIDEAIAKLNAEAEEEDDISDLIPEPPKPVEEPRCDETEDAAVLQELADLVRSEVGIVVMAPELLARLEKLVPYTTAALFLKGADHRTLVPIYAAGMWTELLTGMEIRIGEGASGYVAARGEPLLNAPAAMDLARRLRPSENLELNSTLCVPLLLGEEVVGTITLYHSSYTFYHPYHVDRLERAAKYAVQAIEQTQRCRLELPLPCDDPITRLPNAYSLMQFLAGQLNVSQTREDEFTVIQLSLEAVEKPAPGMEDAERNIAMRAVARILEDTVRDGDFVARSSASSFTLVLPGCGEREARRTARRVLDKARTLGGDGAITVAMRVGIAVYRRDGSTVDDLLRVARERLAEVSHQPLKLPALAAAASAAEPPLEN